MAIDDGVHPKTATATISVIVEDVNDNAPSFKYNYRPVIQEHSSPRQILELFAKDDDDPLKKNGPPFTFSMSSNASDEIKSGFKLETIQSEYILRCGVTCLFTKLIHGFPTFIFYS